MEPDRAALEAAHTWFSVDSVPDAGMTAFRRRARFQQAMWREKSGLGGPGLSGKVDSPVPNGSLLQDDAAEAGGNFLSSDIRSTVSERLANKQRGETLETRRLMRNLLSSMPMCFNLFGELPHDPRLASSTADFLLPDSGGKSVEVMFEWSPGRGDERFTRDRTAFDVSLHVQAEDGQRQIIGVETKYHELPTREKKPTEKQLERHQLQRAHYTSIAERSGLFRAGWQDAVLDTDLEQLWRDHLLVLSMLADGREWSHGLYVLVHPARNTAVASAAKRYAACLTDSTTFRAVTLEELLDAHVTLRPTTETAFRDRYLWA